MAGWTQVTVERIDVKTHHAVAILVCYQKEFSARIKHEIARPVAQCLAMFQQRQFAGGLIDREY